ncbi:MAG: hypothetical protein CUN51_00135 [Candidatus Thermofonsia Clade 1 bacterium]|uniref:PPM-type phosphatase domain-containing protein n=1 Tax=Candidatus Thermofonsia Clade 1 bacterium TaxID=2364210 RepID=A0A2M8P3F7_9CHLR|nr:MAG: hypothetical protein CUN51_00135 [Candidatus Thermofonsia Clade 1 bacterium]
MVERPAPKLNWEIYAQSVTGSQHRREGRICQDSQKSASSEYGCVVAVADGHGSQHSPNSAEGSKKAVEAAVSQLLYFVLRVQDQPLERVQRYAREELARRIVHSWIKDVRQRAKQAQQAELPLPTLLRAYGSTLLAVLATERYILYFQLGDGDILRVEADGNVSRPVVRNADLIAEETHSLCMVDQRTQQPNAWLYASVHLELLTQPPALIMLSTDGYANSFRSDEDFLQVGSDILHLIQREGWEYVKENLSSWLEEATQRGSGDDIAVGLMWNAASTSIAETER